MAFNPSQMSDRTLKQFVDRLSRHHKSRPCPSPDHWPPRRTLVQEEVAHLLGFASWHQALQCVGKDAATAPSCEPYSPPKDGSSGLLGDVLERALAACSSRKRGLVCVSGLAGSGKTTLLLELLRRFPASRKACVAAMEPELQEFSSALAGAGAPNILQYPVDGYHRSLRLEIVRTMKRSPDTIVVGEADVPKTMEGCLTAAMTGHRVYTTTQAPGVVEALAKHVLSYPQHLRRTQVIDALSASILWIGVRRVGSPGGGHAQLVEAIPFGDDLVDFLLEGSLADIPEKIWGAMDAMGMSFFHDCVFKTPGSLFGTPGLLEPKTKLLAQLGEERGTHRRKFIQDWRVALDEPPKDSLQASAHALPG